MRSMLRIFYCQFLNLNRKSNDRNCRHYPQRNCSRLSRQIHSHRTNDDCVLGCRRGCRDALASSYSRASFASTGRQIRTDRRWSHELLRTRRDRGDTLQHCSRWNGADALQTNGYLLPTQNRVSIG